jgi:hypothetical protein
MKTESTHRWRMELSPQDVNAIETILTPGNG